MRRQSHKTPAKSFLVLSGSCRLPQTNCRFTKDVVNHLFGYRIGRVSYLFQPWKSQLKIWKIIGVARHKAQLVGDYFRSYHLDVFPDGRYQEMNRFAEAWLASSRWHLPA